jgi:signal transduction histidine kinase/DNA-binding response OmpR family regulator/TPR repeat protein
MKTLLILLLLSVSPLLASSQNKILDSLKNELEKHPLRDTVRVKLLSALSYYSYESPENTLKYAEEALQLATELNYHGGRAAALTNLGTYYWEKSDHQEALKKMFLALTAYEKGNRQKGIYQSYNNIAGLYVAVHDYDKAIEYLNKAADMGKKNESFVDYGDLYHNLGEVHARKKDLEHAKEYYLKALAVREQKNDLYKQSVVHHDLAEVLYQSSDSKGAVLHFEKALTLARQVNAPPVIAACLGNLSKILIQLGDYEKAEASLKESQQLVDKTGNKSMQEVIYGTYSQLYEQRKDYHQALQYFRKKTQLKDSLFNEENIRKMAETENMYETQKKEQEIALLNQKAETQVLWRNSLTAGLLITLTASIVIFLLQRSRTRKAKLLLDTQQLLNRQMQETDKMRSRFFANISHEFRTPLTLILSPVEEKLALTEVSQKDRITFQSIRRSANRLLELINQLLELSRLESGFMKLQLQPGDLHSFIMPILSAFDSMADISQAKYTREVNLPTVTVLFDADKLEKVLNNLLSNAFKFSLRGGIVDVRVSGVEKETSVELILEIRNSGPVIPADIQGKIFEPFFQGPTTSPHAMPGTGLGLSLVKELVKLYQGDIRVASTDKDGTAFIVSLCLEKSEFLPVETPFTSKKEAIADMEEVPESSRMDADPNSYRDKEKILVVEDNPDVRALIRQGLESHYHVVEAAGGDEGIEMASEKAIDLVVSDVMMPQMNGIELCHLLKSNELTSHIPLILLTAKADHESKLEGLRTGADDYLVKPFNMQELQARIGNLISQRKKLIRKYNQGLTIHPHEVTVTSLDERFMRRAIDLVENNLDNMNLGVDMMAEELGMSRTNLHRKLKSITGLAISEFIQDFRLRRAAQLITKKADTISQIAYQTGFSDQSYFTKCFKKKFGKTPSEYGIA